jgi:hypothetical protein
MRGRLALGTATIACALGCSTSAQSTNPAGELSPAWFANPPLQYRPAVSVPAGGVPADQVPAQLTVLADRGFGAFMIAPQDGRPPVDPRATRDPAIQRVIRAAQAMPPAIGESDPPPDFDQLPQGSIAPYLSEEYFRRYAALLALAHARGMTTVLYDELGYPSGSAGGGRIDPKYYRKLLVRTEHPASPKPTDYTLPRGTLMAAVAMNEATKKRIDLTPRAAHGHLAWNAPGPGWKIDFFTVVPSVPQGGAEDYHAVVDYFDPAAVQQFIDTTYEAYAAHAGRYFGNTIRMTFFDDVGIYSAERSWSPRIADRFRAKTGLDPATYYPALWEDIGPDTTAARVAFFGARADALADGFPRIVTQWAARHGLLASGHTPGQYELQPTDMNGDPFKFYRAQPVPMIDVIFRYGFGRDGYKLTTSAADAMDKPVVAAEQFTTCGTRTGYKRAMDSFARGVNYLITCGRSDIGGPRQFAEWAGRSAMLLTGGRRVADIAVLYPIASLQAYYRFEAPDNREGPMGRYAPASADYLAVGDMLTGTLHRDFTFLHPDDFAGPKLRVEGDRLVLANRVNWQRYRVLILPGAEVWPVATLRKVAAFVAAGGQVIATTQLPSHAAEFGKDEELRALLVQIFRPGANARGGRAVFVAHPDPASLRQALGQMAPDADLAFEDEPAPHSGGGELAYIHKVKDGKQIYFLANSSDDRVASQVRLRGRLRISQWNPYTGATSPVSVSVTVRAGQSYTKVPVTIDAASSTFLIGE